MSEENKFTPYEERCLGLVGTEYQKDPATLPLRKILDCFPWMVQVAECDFNGSVANSAIVMQAAIENYYRTIAEYREQKEKKEAENEPSTP